jgi:hypothetical protein
VYIGPDDALQLEMKAPSVAADVNVTLRRLLPDGTISTDFYSYHVSTVGTAKQTVLIPPAEGYILSVHLESDTPARGQLLVKMHARHNLGGTDDALGHLLVQGYVSVDDHIGYPQSPTESSISGHGWFHTVSAPAVAANTQAVIGVPTGLRWRVINIQAQVASTFAAPQLPVLAFTVSSPPSTYYFAGPSVPSGALTTGLDWAPGFPFNAATGFYTAPFPPEVFMTQGADLSLNFSGSPAGFQINYFAAFVEEWIGV